jgi:hypothetical protein
MSFDIPPQIEPSIKEFARAQHITADEAIVRLLEEGLRANQPRRMDRDPAASRIPGLSGEPMSDEEAAVMDEVVEIAMESRN